MNTQLPVVLLFVAVAAATYALLDIVTLDDETQTKRKVVLAAICMSAVAALNGLQLPLALLAGFAGLWLGKIVNELFWKKRVLRRLSAVGRNHLSGCLLIFAAIAFEGMMLGFKRHEIPHLLSIPMIVWLIYIEGKHLAEVVENTFYSQEKMTSSQAKRAFAVWAAISLPISIGIVFLLINLLY